ncbi:transport between ER and Golgi ATPase protein, partial [Cladochytrium tenue]
MPRRGGGDVPTMRVAKTPNDGLALSNCVIVCPRDFHPKVRYILVEGRFVFTIRPHEAMNPGDLGFSRFHRVWASLSLNQDIRVEIYDPFADLNCYLAKLDIQISFFQKGFETSEYFDSADMAKAFMKSYVDQMYSMGQHLCFDYRGITFIGVVTAVDVVDFESLKQGRAGRDQDGAPNFKFEDLGIGGLEKEFGQIFRRAFASRIFPPSIVEKLGIQHVKGMILYGPPGTGKTLIARQIGKMLNAREPIIVNGPEILNKYVGQSEENIRKLFSAAEQEYKARGEESSLHIIIFDELDAICKQRGAKNDGTGVGDSVVNQLLSKMDGVEPLNNILVIGMTNRLDMIDEALLRPGRMEIKMEISLPDENGRLQILNMRANNLLERDVDLMELASLTKNFSGAEIAGLVKAASSWSFNRHVKVGTVAGVSEDYERMKVNRDDFLSALDE